MLLTGSDQAASASDRPLPLRVFPCPFPVGPHVNYLYWHSNTEGDPANQWLRAQLMAAGKALARNGLGKTMAKRRGITRLQAVQAPIFSSRSTL
jgi:DNA-binding transcriptional LysR family regulator